jgi:CRISPR system Cascade subunit CasB
MWPLYTELTGSTGAITPRLRAEHHALVLYGFHQQSQQRAMHVPGVSIGAAAGALIATDSYSGAAVGRRFSAAATTDAVDELAVLLRGLVTQFRNEGIGIDYELLFQHLVSWQYPDSRARVRRRWGGDYFKAHIPQTDPPRS